MHFIKEFRWVGFSREVSTGSECRQMKVWLTIPRKKNMGEKLPLQECSMHVPVILTMVGPGRSCQQRNWRKHGRGGYDIKILHTSGVQKRVDYILRDALILDLLNPKLLDRLNTSSPPWLLLSCILTLDHWPLDFQTQFWQLQAKSYTAPTPKWSHCEHWELGPNCSKDYPVNPKVSFPVKGIAGRIVKALWYMVNCEYMWP